MLGTKGEESSFPEDVKMSFLRSHRTSVLLLLALHLTMGAGLASHNHGAFYTGGADAIASHDCGAREVHLPLGDFRNCSLCLVSLQSVALPALDDPAVVLSYSGLAVLDLPEYCGSDLVRAAGRSPPESASL